MRTYGAGIIAAMAAASLGVVARGGDSPEEMDPFVDPEELRPPRPRDQRRISPARIRTSRGPNFPDAKHSREIARRLRQKARREAGRSS